MRLSSKRPMRATRRRDHQGMQIGVKTKRQTNEGDRRAPRTACSVSPTPDCQAMQAIHDHVTVYALPPPCYGPEHSTKRKKPRAPTSPVLQYVVENTGLRAVTFRVDFSGSRNAILTDAGDFSIATGDSYPAGMTVECTVYPFERRVMVAVAKQSMRERAMIRAAYELLAEFEPDIDEITRTLKRHNEDLRELSSVSRTSFAFSQQHGRTNDRSSYSNVRWNQQTATDFCADVNQYFSQCGEVWVDSTSPLPANGDDMESWVSKTGGGRSGLDSTRSVPLAMCAWRHLHSLCDDERLWCVFLDDAAPAAAEMTRSLSKQGPTSRRLVAGGDVERARGIARILSGLPGQQTFLCALAIAAADIHRWKRSWFSLWSDSLSGHHSLDHIKKNVVALPVRLCERGVQWTCVVIDLLMPAFPLGNGLVAPRSVDGELWPALLHKAYVKLKGSYSAVSCMPTINILRELLGMPCVCLYDPAATSQTSKERALQRRLDRIFSRVRQARDQTPSNQPMLIVSFAAVPTPSIPAGAGFSILNYATDPSSKNDFVALGDVDGILRKAIGDKKLSSDLEVVMESRTESVVAIPWQEFVKLQPSVWTLLPSVKHVRRVRSRFLWRHQGQDGTSDPRAVVAAVSVASLSTVVVAGHLKVPGSNEDAGGDQSQCQRHSRRVPARLQVCICLADELAEPWTSIDQGGSGDDSTDMEQDSSRDQISVQTVRTLAPGEYIIAIRVVDVDAKTKSNNPDEAECSCTTCNDQESEQGAVLTPSTVEANLAQLFACVDREMRGFLTAGDLSGLLYQRDGGATPSPEGIAAIEEHLIARFGSPVNGHDDEDEDENKSDENTRVEFERGLHLDDLRDVYRCLALNQRGATSEGQTSDRRYQALVWHDLIALLGDALCMAESNKAEIRVDDIAELVGCVSSNSRLVGCVPLPVPEASLELS